MITSAAGKEPNNPIRRRSRCLWSVGLKAVCIQYSSLALTLRRDRMDPILAVLGVEHTSCATCHEVL